jgi:hypothetical protein
MWNIPIQEELDRIPRLYQTEDIPLKDKLIHLHFFIGSCNWFIAEYDGEDLFWGYACLNGDHLNAEWGYISFIELKDVKVHGWLEIDRDINWQIRKASEIDLIRNL